jgi:hypothetical protein
VGTGGAGFWATGFSRSDPWLGTGFCRLVATDGNVLVIDCDPLGTRRTFLTRTDLVSLGISTLLGTGGADFLAMDPWLGTGFCRLVATDGNVLAIDIDPMLCFFRRILLPTVLGSLGISTLLGTGGAGFPSMAAHFSRTDPWLGTGFCRLVAKDGTVLAIDIDPVGFFRRILLATDLGTAFCMSRISASSNSVAVGDDGDDDVDGDGDGAIRAQVHYNPVMDGFNRGLRLG